MEYWQAALEAVRRQIAETEQRIKGLGEADDNQQLDLIRVLEGTLARTIIQREFIEKQIEFELARRAKRQALKF